MNKVLRSLFGFFLLLIGLAIVLADVHVAYLERGSAHTVNIIVGVLIAFAGGYVMMPTLADALADAVVKRVPSLATLWPGGRRQYDPPPAPNVPAPPSAVDPIDPIASPRPALTDDDKGVI